MKTLPALAAALALAACGQTGPLKLPAPAAANTVVPAPSSDAAAPGPEAKAPKTSPTSP